MSTIAENIQDAEKFFLENSTGYLICVNGRRKMIVKSYPEAVKWFGSFETPKML